MLMNASSVGNNTYMASSFAAGHTFSKVSSPNIYIEYFRQGFASTIVRTYRDDNHSEKWYRYDDDQNMWVEIDPDQLWFWTEAWQQGERQADEDLRLGRYEDFDDLDSFFDI